MVVEVRLREVEGVEGVEIPKLIEKI